MFATKIDLLSFEIIAKNEGLNVDMLNLKLALSKFISKLK